MSFLSKLKERLFKSSSKIEDGLTAIVDEDIVQENNKIPTEVLISQKKSSNDKKSLNEHVNKKLADPENFNIGYEKTPKQTEKKGFFSNIVKKVELSKKRRVINDSMLESIEELLISADMGVNTALKISSSLATSKLGSKLSVEDLKDLMSSEIKDILKPVSKPIPIYNDCLQVILVVGVNGSGKTTTIGKLASQFKSVGKSVMIVAGDTFRAAAVEQLQIWGERAEAPVIVAPQGSDPAALTFEAIEKAQKQNKDILLIDTAGRLQNKKDLMEELNKVVRVIKKKIPEAPHNTLLVLDASTGQNAINQVEIFQNTANVSGLIMTKLDGTAKGGVLVAIAERFKLPIHAIGIGEGIDDLQPFDPDEFTLALTGVDID
jgi:fused signal recognition particle receptor